MNYLLTFELEDETLKIHGSPEGLKTLIQNLETLLQDTKKGDFDHAHLMEDGELGLTLEKQSETSELIRHVKLYCWNL